jgi:hypothetical protein
MLRVDRKREKRVRDKRFSGEAEENHGKLKTENPIFGSKPESETSRMGSKIPDRSDGDFPWKNMGSACSTNGGKERCIGYRVLVGKPEGRRPLGRPQRRWEDNTEMDLRIVGWRGMDWVNLFQDGDRWQALVNAVMNLRVPHNAGNFLTS